MRDSLPDFVSTTIQDTRARIAEWRRQGLTVGMVPTMGTLHEGHLTLVDRSKARTDRTLTTIFLNPTQFGPGEDFAAYPKTFERDLELLEARKCDLVLAPSIRELFPDGHETRKEFPTQITVHGLSEPLCGEFREGHFTAVATIVMKLFMIGLPDVAFFGEKDYQQLQVVRRMVRDLSVPIEIEAVPTVRDTDGLALSSRNAYLTPEEREIAPWLYRVLGRAVEELRNGGDVEAVTLKARATLIEKGFQSVDYVTLAHAESLRTLEKADRPARLLAVARLGKARLIDNVPYSPA